MRLASPALRVPSLLVAAIVAFLVMCLPAAAQAEATPVDAPVPDAIGQRIAIIDTLLAAVDSTPDRDKDGLLYRLDGHILEAHDMVVANLQELPDGPGAPPLPAALLGAAERLRELSLERIHALAERIDLSRNRFEKFDTSPEALIAESFVQDMVSIRFRHLRAVIRQILALEKLGQVPTEYRDEIQETLSTFSQRLNGQIRLDARTLADLRSRMGADPENADLRAARNAVERKQARSLDSMATLVELLDLMGMDSSEHRALQLQERGSIGVEILDRQVFLSLLGQNLVKMRDTVVKSGPNLLLRAVAFLAILLVAWLLAHVIRRTTRRVMERETIQLSQLLKSTLVSLSFGATLLVGIVVALSALGVSLVPMVAGLGVAGIIIGFALQDSLSNFASGWMILLYRPYDVEDHIHVSSAEGVVKKMNLVATTITTFDNQVLVIPNNKIWGDTIVNYTASDVRRVDIEIGFSYKEDFDRVEEVVRDILAKNEHVLDDPPPNIHMGRMADSAVTMMVKPWVKTANYWTVLWDVQKQVKKRFDEEGISIPFPQRDVHVFPGEAASQLLEKRPERGESEPDPREELPV